MQFDWTSFALEGLNFLVLMWILTRFLYRPVLNVLDARRKAVADGVEAAQKMREDAEALRTQYESRLSDWQTEREAARQALERELSTERAARLEAMKAELDAEREKARQRDAATAATRDRELARRAAENAYRQVSSMLERLASKQLTDRIAALFADDLDAWDTDQRETLSNAAAAMRPDEAASVASAHALDDACRQLVAQGLQRSLARPVPLAFTVRPELIAGLRVAVGSCLLQANLADELAFFMERNADA
jgi:F-type H+-transporting ATPase subunit b